jgi:hypothetical protein
MNKLLLILLCLPIIGFGQQTYVPDDFFEFKLVNLGYDSILDDSVLTANINTITYLNITYQNISDLTGIEDFVNLEELYLLGNNLSSLDISNNLFLNTLGCSLNQLTSIDVSDNILLTNLYLSGNQLGSIDISNNVNLVELNLTNNLLSTIDITNNLLLNGLGVGSNQLTNLDISNHILLSGFSCENNQFTSLDVSQNIALTSLYCSDNQITSIDLSGAFNLTALYCYNNQLLNLDLRNGNNANLQMDSQGNPNLFCIDVDNIALSNVLWGANIDFWSSFSTNCVTALGCTDLIACNYDTLATIDDGSCTYPVIWYQTPLLCDGDSIVVGSSVYDTAGNYIDTLSSANGCDSIVNTYLMIDENTSSYDTLSVGASIVWNGIPLNASGDYSVTLTNSVGCDSIVNLNLTVTTTGISDITSNKSNLVKITDVLGKETPYRRNTPLFYIYDDGTVEKRIVIE